MNRPLRVFERRVVWHTLGVLIALAIAWMVCRAYRQPDFLLDLSNMLFC